MSLRTAPTINDKETIMHRPDPLQGELDLTAIAGCATAWLGDEALDRVNSAIDASNDAEDPLDLSDFPLGAEAGMRDLLAA